MVRVWTRRSVGRRWATIAVVVSVVAAGCGDDGSSTDGAGGAPPTASTTPADVVVDVGVDGTLPLADEALDDPEVTTVATDLAPSQVSGSTVPEPSTPPPCAADDVDIWTAQVRVVDGLAEAVLRVRNVSERWCEPDVGRSPLIDPRIEPDVWLQPGETADLLVGHQDGGCGDPSLVGDVQVGIGTDSVVVPTVVVTCGWWLSAFYPNGPVGIGCEPDQLELAVVATAVLVRNASAQACGLGGIVEVAGDRLAGDAPIAADDPEPIRELMSGDVVAFGRPGPSDCDGGGRVVLVDEVVGELTFDDVPCGIVFDLGGGRPWFGAPDHPVSSVPSGPASAEAALDALDPFAITQ